MNRLEAGALGYPTLAGNAADPRALRTRGRAANRHNECRVGSNSDFFVGATLCYFRLWADEKKPSKNYGAGEKGVYVGGFPGKEEISASNIHQ